MAEKFEKIARAIVNAFRGEASETEQNEVQQWLDASEANRRLINDFEDPDWLYTELAEFECNNLEEHKRRLWQKIAAIEDEKPKINWYEKINWYKVAKIASAIVCIGLIGLFWLRHSKSSRSKSAADLVKKDTVQSAGTDTGAIRLIMADGTQHQIGSGQNGRMSTRYRIFKQGDKLIFKKDYGLNAQIGLGYHKLLVPAGKQYQVELADGSTVWLDGGSSITIPVIDTGGIRSVMITGEAFFEVTKSKTPFVVGLPNSTELEVLGTTFNVNAYANEPGIKATLLAGAVKIKKGSNSMDIKPGQQAQIIGNNITINRNVDTEKIVAWKNGDFKFDNDSLTVVARELARWYNLELEMDNAPPILVNYHGKRSRPADTVLNKLKATDSTIHMSIKANRLIVTK